MKRKLEISSLSERVPMLQKHPKWVKIPGTIKYDMVIFWDLEWVYDGYILDEIIPFGAYTNRTHIVDCAFLSHDDSIKENSHIRTDIDCIRKDTFFTQNNFQKIVDNATAYPHMETFWKMLKSKLKGNVLFLSYSSFKKKPVDLMVLENSLGGHLKYIPSFKFRDAREIIMDGTKCFEEKQYMKLSELFRNVMGKDIENAHEALGDAKALKDIFKKLGLIQSLIK